MIVFFCWLATIPVWWFAKNMYHLFGDSFHYSLPLVFCNVPKL